MTQAQEGTAERLAPSTMKAVGTVDERYQSYNVEMFEVTGGKFWKPYNEIAAASEGGAAPAGDTPAGMDPGL
ncbi:hypothetical protein WG29040_02260 [Pseudomonas sp. PAMC 29040]|uniref:hypothetical protein n=1 Tax=Pseudomonas sp. PAMC 29040 TaxID=2498450 RepID=UPI000FA90369|nr:hypothetical protein [Pseudomonas sp. PAMC 29040]RUT42426.1 hypothetical protein WG29040_02260 [Pseudomonas sp. PAMC 29040]